MPKRPSLDQPEQNRNFPRQIILVTGPQCAGARVVSESLACLGTAVPKERSDTGPSDPQGPIEDTSVSHANDRVLHAMQRHWTDCRPMLQPEGAEQGFAQLITAEAGGTPLLALEDPRLALLAPTWVKAAQQAGAAARFIVVVRDPIVAASSLMARDGLDPEAAIALWLRYMLDAERNSRGQPRIVVSDRALAEHPVATLERVGTTLDIAWPVAPSAARADLAALDESAPLVSDAGMQTPLMDFAHDVHAALLDLAEDRGTGDAKGLSRIDRLSAEFDAKCPSIHARMVYDQLGNAVRQKRRGDAALTELQNIQSTVAEVRSQNEALTQQASATSAQRDAALADLGKATADLTRARRYPLRPFRDYLIFKFISGLSRQSPPLPKRVADRLARSAEKRDPSRAFEALDRSAQTDPVQTTASQTAVAIPTSASLSVTGYPGRAERVAGRRDILIVSHDASRTGASVLALNLVQALSQRYNVTTLCLRGGDVLDAFQQHSVAVWEAEDFRTHEARYTEVLDDITPEQGFAFAITSSVEARYVVNSLNDRNIPSVAVLQDATPQTVPKTSFVDVIFNADHTVFSSQLARDHALHANHLSRGRCTHVVPHGKCIAPKAAQGPGQGQAERDRLQALLRPEGVADQRFIVVGTGCVSYGKGVDLFIDTALRVGNSPEGKNVQFVWVGAGFDPLNDPYAMSVQDQLKRSGLSETVLFLPETSEMEAIYQLADALVITSRFDPVLHDAIDAMGAGCPVLCFDQATGLAETLADADLSTHCVARYLAPQDLADRLIALISSETLREEVGRKTRDYALQAFDFDAYARRIESLALLPAPPLDADSATILDSGSFDPAFCLPSVAAKRKPATVVQRYLKRARTGVDARKPEPGFHPYVFAQHMGGAGPAQSDPYAEFLRQGRPEGPWMARVLKGGTGRAVAAPLHLRAALHIHAFYTDGFDDIVRRLNSNVTRPDLFVSVADAAAEQWVRHHLSAYGGDIASVEIVPNAGRDIGPLLTCFGPDMVRDYDVVGHIHTKKSPHIAQADLIQSWVKFAYSGVLGGKHAGPMMDLILQDMQRDEEIGIVYPDDPHIVGWSGNIRQARALAQRLDLGPLPQEFNFPVGTMFWMRSAALKPFVDLGFDWSDYPSEPLAMDGTMLHAIERLFGVAPSLKGWKTVVTNTPGLSR